MQIKYLSIAGLNLDKNLDETLDKIDDRGRTKNDNIFVVSLLTGTPIEPVREKNWNNNK